LNALWSGDWSTGVPDLAVRLLGDLALPGIEADDEEVALWAASGAMHLSGEPDGPPVIAPGNPGGAADVLLRHWASATGSEPLLGSRPAAALLAERAAFTGMTRRGGISCGGTSRILPVSGVPVAVSLPRRSDWQLVPALTEGRVDHGWTQLAQWLSSADPSEVYQRAQLLGIPLAVIPGPTIRRRPGVQIHTVRRARERRGRLRVVDLSSLWAGPLAAHLLGVAGADVIKVESTQRPDGARYGNADFFDLLHGGHRAVAYDLSGADGQGKLLDLILAADVVIEASRPRALEQLGVRAQSVVEAGVTWVSITAYGRSGANGLRVGFGDDVAAGAGLVAPGRKGPVFCGDAIADPLAGLAAAAAVGLTASHGEARLLDVSMSDVVSAAVAGAGPSHAAQVRRTPNGRGWLVDTGKLVCAVARPHRRRAVARAPDLGSSNDEVSSEWHL